MQAPHEYSFLDQEGRRYITLGIDIMINNGRTFFTILRTTVPMYVSMRFGWVADTQFVPFVVYERYPTLKAIRNQVRIMLGDAKPVKPKQPYMANNNNNTYDKERNYLPASGTNRPFQVSGN